MRCGAIQASRGAGTATRLGVSDDGILGELEEVGYAPDMVVLLETAGEHDSGFGPTSKVSKESIRKTAPGPSGEFGASASQCRIHQS